MRERMLYFVYNRYTGLIKIGISDNFLMRLKNLECAAGVRLDTIGTLGGGADLEAGLHASFYATREVGEWFRPCETLLALARNPDREAIATLIASRAAEVRAHFRAVEAEREQANAATKARRLEAKRKQRERELLEAEKKVAKERRKEERRRAALEKEAVERHAAMQQWQERSAALLEGSGLIRTSPQTKLIENGQRDRNKRFAGLAS
jgi:flagellar biosynthesis GTPase FlhF